MGRYCANRTAFCKGGRNPIFKYVLSPIFEVRATFFSSEYAQLCLQGFLSKGVGVVCLAGATYQPYSANRASSALQCAPALPFNLSFRGAFFPPGH